MFTDICLDCLSLQQSLGAVSSSSWFPGSHLPLERKHLTHLYSQPASSFSSQIGSSASTSMSFFAWLVWNKASLGQAGFELEISVS